MKEKVYLENILTLTKSLGMLYINGVIESSNEKNRNIMLAGLETTLNLQDELYEQMKKDGYYEVTNIDKKEINKTLKKLTQNN